MPQSPQPPRRKAPALARAVTPARPTPTVCLQPSPPQRPSPGTGPVRLYTDSPTTLGSSDVVQSFTFSKIARGDAIYYGSGPCPVFSPYNVGRMLTQDGDSVKLLVKSPVESRAVSSASPRPSPVPPTDPGLRNRGSQLAR